MPDRPDYLEPYHDAVARHGATFPALLWQREEAQERRFGAILDEIRPAGQDVLDVGCGLGDLYMSVVRRRIALRSYRGIEAIPCLAAEAEKRVGACVCIQCGDPLQTPSLLADPPADWIILSGTLNTMRDDDARLLVLACDAAARRGVAFNFLSDAVAPELRARDCGPARRFDTASWLSWTRETGRRVRLRDDYLGGHDALIVMEKS